MKAVDRLQAGQAAAQAGQYEEALREFIWFHDNALAEVPALSGVRLSYALMYWLELGERFPPAIRALEEIRDRKSAALLPGEMNVSAFRDVVAINESFKTESKTYRLYLDLAQAQPDLAKACAQGALPAIVREKDYQLAARLMRDPETSIRRDMANLNDDIRMIKHRPYTRALRRWAYIRNTAESVQRLLTIVSGNGDQAEALRLKELSIGLIESPSLRRAFRAEFLKPAKPPAPKF